MNGFGGVGTRRAVIRGILQSRTTHGYPHRAVQEVEGGGVGHCRGRVKEEVANLPEAGPLQGRQLEWVSGRV